MLVCMGRCVILRLLITDEIFAILLLSSSAILAQWISQLVYDTSDERAELYNFSLDCSLS